MKKKHLIPLVLGVLTVMFLFFTITFRAEADTSSITLGDYTYLIVDGNASIQKYNGRDTLVEVPTSFTYEGVKYRIRKIENFAYEGCTSIEKLVIPEGIIALGYGAFKNCTNITEIFINETLGDCSGYNVEGGEKYIDNAWRNPGFAYTCPFYNVGANSSSLTVTFDENATYVPAYLFGSGASETEGVYSHVTKVVFGDSVTSVGSYAFYRCYDLKTIVMGSKLTSIGSQAFAMNIRLEKVTWGKALREIWDHAFFSCTAITSLSIPSRVTTLGSYAFENCTSLQSLSCPASLTRLDYGVFKNCTNLSSITIKGNIGDHSGYNADNAERYIDGGWRNPAYSHSAPFYNIGANTSGVKVTFSKGVTRVPAYLFATAGSESDGVHAHISEVVLSDTITSVGVCAFHNCMDLQTVKMGNKLSSLESYAFSRNVHLKNITWSPALREIGDHAFYHCTELTSVNLPSKVTTIFAYAFEECSSLVEVVLPSSVTALHYGAFKNSTGLRKLIINGNIGDLSSFNAENGEKYIDGGWRNPAYKHTSAFYNTGADASSFTVAFGSGVTHIPAFLFATGGVQSDNAYCAITKVVIPASVTSIGEGAFCNCYKLTAVDYKNAKTAWQKIEKGERNDSLLSAKIGYALGATTKITATNLTKGIKISWAKVTNATGYLVYRNGKLLKAISSGSTVSLTDTEANTNGQKYVYKIIAKNKSGNSAFSKSLSVYCLLRPSISVAKNTGTKTMGIKWNKNSKASGYQLQYSLKSDFSSKKTMTISGAENVIKKITGLTKGNTYYVRVCSYKKVGNVKSYSCWSTAKKVKITK